MKIAMGHVDLPNESRGGVAYQVHELANRLVDRGHQVTVYTLSPAFADCRYRVHRYPLPGWLRRVQWFALAGCLARTDFSAHELLHMHGDNYLLWGRHPQLRTFYGSSLDEALVATGLRRRALLWLLAGLERLGARVADLSVGISEATRARLPSIREIVPCGVDLDGFHPGDKSKQPSVLFVGTRLGRKRGQWLAEQFQREVLPRMPEARLWAVSDQPLAGEGVVNHGKLPAERLRELYRRAWVFCLPSLYEGFGVPYIEAMASGTAVLASPNPGAREVLAGDPPPGELCEDAGLGARLRELLVDTGRRSELERRGTERAREYAWELVVERYEALYRELLEPAGGG